MPIEVPESVANSAAYQHVKKIEVTYQKYLDQSVPYTLYRWIALGGVLLIFFARIVYAQGWYIICYALGIYLLNLLLAFLTPKFDPSLEQEMKNELIEEGVQDEEPEPEDEEFRPFIRRLPEFKFWYNAARATTLSLFLSFWSIFDIPVFWPILLMYFIILFTLTMRKQIQHMIKYKYLPFDIGKTKYRK
ncbi:retrieval of early ER protein Rer1 [Suhomyces tanzawaensis NRRL Y-17324]|uniref:Protein RER1 n=1 Tax=Suhomyces tanzawaensis NRRL Y-17324 TaxID=984487 RepID=A0A1E4SE69_9ASCO|nr:retrieval of early ER protein Rer1 [Suhomyces tanzawaensis NRRL Y-17324]ODV77783.1 retrieval of early ER protein Rer1 [Suhomyces tanzawaensis NRRL Y-17324]